jgi:hypothetical protein
MSAIAAGSEQRLRFCDFRKLRRRRKAFKRRGEDGVRLGSAADALIKLRQRERRAQLETFCLLLLRDGDGGEEGFFGRRAASLGRPSVLASCRKLSTVCRAKPNSARAANP